MSKAARRRARKTLRREERRGAAGPGSYTGRTRRRRRRGTRHSSGVSGGLDGLDDNGSAWARCQGRAWGGRGEGGRGLRSTCNSSTAVRNIHLRNVSLLGGDELLQSATLQIAPQRRFGLIGRNGVGRARCCAAWRAKPSPDFRCTCGFCSSTSRWMAQIRVLEVLLGADTARASLLEEQAALERLTALLDRRQQRWRRRR